MVRSLHLKDITVEKLLCPSLRYSSKNDWCDVYNHCSKDNCFCIGLQLNADYLQNIQDLCLICNHSIYLHFTNYLFSFPHFNPKIIHDINDCQKCDEYPYLQYLWQEWILNKGYIGNKLPWSNLIWSPFGHEKLRPLEFYLQDKICRRPHNNYIYHTENCKRCLREGKILGFILKIWDFKNFE